MNGKVRTVTDAAETPIARLKAEFQQPTWKEKNPPELLYHYTSAAGFHGIVSSGILRGSHFAYLNDSTELLYGSRLAKDLLHEYSEKLDGSTAAKRIFQLSEALMGLFDDKINKFLACFCATPDLLSQWRAYGSKGDGTVSGSTRRAYRLRHRRT